MVSFPRKYPSVLTANSFMRDILNLKTTSRTECAACTPRPARALQHSLEQAK